MNNLLPPSIPTVLESMTAYLHKFRWPYIVFSMMVKLNVGSSIEAWSLPYLKETKEKVKG